MTLSLMTLILMTLILMTLILKYSNSNISGICEFDKYDIIFKNLPAWVNFI